MCNYSTGITAEQSANPYDFFILVLYIQYLWIHVYGCIPEIQPEDP
jgi:hypothetical protein